MSQTLMTATDLEAEHGRLDTEEQETRAQIEAKRQRADELEAAAVLLRQDPPAEAAELRAQVADAERRLEAMAKTRKTIGIAQDVRQRIDNRAASEAQACVVAAAKVEHEAVLQEAYAATGLLVEALRKLRKTGKRLHGAIDEARRMSREGVMEAEALAALLPQRVDVNIPRNRRTGMPTRDLTEAENMARHKEMLDDALTGVACGDHEMPAFVTRWLVYCEDLRQPDMADAEA